MTLRIQELDVNSIQIDRERFQSRDAFLTDGSDSDLSDVSVFNIDFAGMIIVWRDPSNGQVYLVDGHNRLDLARRTGTTHILAQFLSQSTAAQAFSKGGLINIARWAFDSGSTVERACACRRQALERAFSEQLLHPGGEVASQLFEYSPDLAARYRSPERGV